LKAAGLFDEFPGIDTKGLLPNNTVERLRAALIILKQD
jgi:hypothetical protein